jgi:hypothetical protein
MKLKYIGLLFCAGFSFATAMEKSKAVGTENETVKSYIIDDLISGVSHLLSPRETSILIGLIDSLLVDSVLSHYEQEVFYKTVEILTALGKQEFTRFEKVVVGALKKALSLADGPFSERKRDSVDRYRSLIVFLAHVLAKGQPTQEEIDLLNAVLGQRSTELFLRSSNLEALKLLVPFITTQDAAAVFQAHVFQLFDASKEESSDQDQMRMRQLLSRMHRHFVQDVTKRNLLPDAEQLLAALQTKIAPQKAPSFTRMTSVFEAIGAESDKAFLTSAPLLVYLLCSARNVVNFPAEDELLLRKLLFSENDLVLGTHSPCTISLGLYLSLSQGNVERTHYFLERWVALKKEALKSESEENDYTFLFDMFILRAALLNGNTKIAIRIFNALECPAGMAQNRFSLALMQMIIQNCSLSSMMSQVLIEAYAGRFPLT